jgi:threonine synthase
MRQILFHSTNNPNLKATFEQALLKGQPDDFGLYMVRKEHIPRFGLETIKWMKGKPYNEIAFQVLHPFLGSEIPRGDLEELLADAYDPRKIPVNVDHITANMYIMWLTMGPTYSFKDFAARFFGRALNYFLDKSGKRRAVLVATSGDTGGAVSDALYGLNNVDVVVFFPAGEITEPQRRQMTTLGGNVYAFAVNGDFDVCQALAKHLLGDRVFAFEVAGNPDTFTSANSISVGRLLPQAVYPFFAHSRLQMPAEVKMVPSIPSGNFGDMMGTVIAREMGLPISRILVGLNPNKPFLEYLETGKYVVGNSIETPSSAMKVSHPSNLARLVDLYGGHMYDKRDPESHKVIKGREGVIGRIPDLEAMRRDFFAFSVSNMEHHDTMRRVFEKYGVRIDPHAAVGWRAAEEYGDTESPVVVYATADHGKFPKEWGKAKTGAPPIIPDGIQKQEIDKEIIYRVDSAPDVVTSPGKKDKLVLSQAQIDEACEKVRKILM